MGLIDEYRPRLGTAYFPRRWHRVALELVESRAVSSGVLALRYGVGR